MKVFQRLLALCFCVCISLIGNAQAQNEHTKTQNLKETNFYKIQKEFNSKWSGRSPVKGQGFNVFRRWEALMEPRVFPSGDITLPSTTYANYKEWEKENLSVTTRSAPNNWTGLGPFAKPSGYDAGVGRVDFLKFDPNNSQIMYVGTPDGGLWKSINGGASWSTNSDFLSVIGCSDLVINPKNTQEMYLATGNWEDDRRSMGVLKSTNGGSSWSTTSLSWNATDNYKIRRMIMDPDHPDTMMVATDGGIFRTTDGWASSPDNSGLDGNYNLYDVKYKPGDFSTVYASGVSGSEVFWKSTDYGETWSAVTSGLPAGSGVSRIIIGTSADETDYVYLLAGDTNNGYKGLYRSTNSGTSFSTRSTTPNILHSNSNAVGSGGQANHDLAIAVAPDNANKVTIGGINQWRSTDGGSTWNLFTYWLGIDTDHPGEGSLVPYTHADIQDIQYLPGSSSTIFATSDGGIYKSTDDGASFTDISNNLSIAQQTNVAHHAINPVLIVTGLQDIGTIKKSGNNYSVINGGDGESAFIDRTAENVIVTSNPYGAHDISYNGGVDKDPMTGIPASSEFYAPISQDPSNADIMYAGGRTALYKNIDFYNHPNTWTTAGTPPGSGSILEYVVAPSNNQVIYTIKADAIGKTTNGGGAWTNVTGTLPLGSALPTQITVSNVDADKAWITFSGYSASNKVWRTTDGGATWSNISSGLPNLPFNTVVHVNDTPNDVIYVGGDVGVYQYENAAANRGPGSWTLFNSGLPNAKVTDLEIFYPDTGAPKLRASTYGRGTWETEIQGAIVPVELVSFTGEAFESENILNWETAIEINLDEYQIERSSDGDHFQMIGKVIPGNLEFDNQYQFLDRDRTDGISFYRLKIIDLDGSFEYSNTVVLYHKGRDHGIKVSPNPATSFVMVTGLSEENSNAVLRDQMGRIIAKQSVINNSQILLSYLPNGTYYISFSNQMGGEETTLKIIKI
ncbi:T9SS type A sorting domain-containing protein [Portibacter lacus]|uniref:T9SS type A sorting domain-containing protein n=1 Tax=Portibacter lacus TaxID=1099794 RepID=A0AA37WBF4_9BACT|nr:T9SS type A sorting domain-containing protein [Portibacter lacus]GLR15611.1 hypothetical protein GCM10007940_02260 [Portibacter lacus]